MVTLLLSVFDLILSEDRAFYANLVTSIDDGITGFLLFFAPNVFWNTGLLPTIFNEQSTLLIHQQHDHDENVVVVLDTASTYFLMGSGAKMMNIMIYHLLFLRSEADEIALLRLKMSNYMFRFMLMAHTLMYGENEVFNKSVIVFVMIKATIFSIWLCLALFKLRAREAERIEAMLLSKQQQQQHLVHSSSSNHQNGNGNGPKASSGSNGNSSNGNNNNFFAIIRRRREQKQLLLRQMRCGGNSIHTKQQQQRRRGILLTDADSACVVGIIYAMFFAIVLTFFPNTFSSAGMIPHYEPYPATNIMNMPTTTTTFNAIQVFCARFNGVNLLAYLVCLRDRRTTPYEMAELALMGHALYCIVFISSLYTSYQQQRIILSISSSTTSTTSSSLADGTHDNDNNNNNNDQLLLPPIIHQKNVLFSLMLHFYVGALMYQLMTTKNKSKRKRQYELNNRRSESVD